MPEKSMVGGWKRDPVVESMRELADDSLGKVVMRHAVEEAESKITRKVNLERITETGNAALLNLIASNVLMRTERNGVLAGVALRQEFESSIPAGLFLEKKEAIMEEAIVEFIQAPRISHGLRACLEEMTFGDTQTSMERLMRGFDSVKNGRIKNIEGNAAAAEVYEDTTVAEQVLGKVSEEINNLSKRPEKSNKGMRGFMIYQTTLGVLSEMDRLRIYLVSDSLGRNYEEATLALINRNNKLELPSVVEGERKKKELATIYIIVAQALIDYGEKRKSDTEAYR